MPSPYKQMSARVIAGWLAENLNEDALRYGGSEFCRFYHHLSRSDAQRLVAELKKEMGRLEKIAGDLPERSAEWVAHFNGADDRNPS